MIGIHAVGRSPNLISTTMDFYREHRHDADGFIHARSSGRDPGRVINEVRIAMPLVS